MDEPALAVTGAFVARLSDKKRSIEMAGERRMHVFFKGTVQGVGFRYTAMDIAQKLALTGWVRNLSDGRVEMVAEGAEKTLEDCLKQVCTAMSGYVRDLSITWEDATGEWAQFSIASTV